MLKVQIPAVLKIKSIDMQTIELNKFIVSNSL